MTIYVLASSDIRLAISSAKILTKKQTAVAHRLKYGLLMINNRDILLTFSGKYWTQELENKREKNGKKGFCSINCALATTGAFLMLSCIKNESNHRALKTKLRQYGK